MWTPATRERHSRDQLRSSTDLTNTEWDAIAPLLPTTCPLGRPRLWSLRDIVNGIFYVLRGGVPWRLCRRSCPRRAQSTATSALGATAAQSLASTTT